MQFESKSRYGDPSQGFSQQLISIKPRAQSINRQKSTFLANSSSESNGNSVRLPRYGKVIAIKRHRPPQTAPSGERMRRCNGQRPIAAGTPCAHRIRSHVTSYTACGASDAISHNGGTCGSATTKLVRNSEHARSTTVERRHGGTCQQGDLLSQIYEI